MPFGPEAVSQQERGGPEADFFVPAEEEPHELTFMQWPVTPHAYDDALHLAETQDKIAEIANIIAEFEPVVMLAGRDHHAWARRKLSADVVLWDVPTDDLWCRDSGPVFCVTEGGKLGVRHLNFNGWGGRFHLPNDGAVAGRVADRLDLPLFDNGLIGEGGGVETDGHGTLMAHESSWIEAGRHPGSRAEIEDLMLEAFGADKMIWAPGLKGRDVTDYHIDWLARFTGPGKIVIQIGEEERADDIWSRADFGTLRSLQAATDSQGRRFEIVRLPEPDLDTWASSYANYYVFNGAVLASSTADRAANAKARMVLAELYPEREIILLDTDILGKNGGGIHCATQQMPLVQRP
ncbi:MAG: agmatine deiminase family protein [Magnetovibrionaceae bacterium]